MRYGQRNVVAWLVAVATFVAMLSAPAHSDVKYEQQTQVKFAGTLGSVMSVMGKLTGAPTKFTETVYVKADKMRTDEDDESTIIDLAEKRFITLDHKRKTYTVMNFEELRQRLEQVTEQMAAEPKEEAPSDEPEEPPTTEVKFNLSVDRTGEKKKVNGYPAERVILTIEAEATNVAPEESEEQGLEGTLVTVIDSWLSDKVKGYDEVEAFQKRMGEVMGGMVLGAGGIENLQTAFTQDPRMKEAMEKAGKEMAKMKGVAVLSTTYMVVVPAGVEFQRGLLFEKKKKKKRGFGGLAGLAKKAMKSKIGVEGEETDQPKEPPKQQTILTVTTTLKNVSTKALSARLFEIPGDYKPATQ